MQKGVSCVRGRIPHDLCRECAMNPLHPCGFPANLLETFRELHPDKDRTEFTPSSLLECDRRTVLRKTHDYWVDPKTEWWKHRGNDIHHYLEMLEFPPRSVQATIREKRLKATVETTYGPQIISGKMDLVVVKRIEEDGEVCEGSGFTFEHKTAYCKIVDYKTKKVDHSLTEPDRKHVMQLNIYAWLVENGVMVEGGRSIAAALGVDRVVVDELELCYIDMSSCRRFTSAGVIQAEGKKPRGKEAEIIELEPIELLPMDVVYGWVRSRIEQKIEAKETLPGKQDALERSGNSTDICYFCPLREVCDEKG